MASFREAVAKVEAALAKAFLSDFISFLELT